MPRGSGMHGSLGLLPVVDIPEVVWREETPGNLGGGCTEA